MGNSSSPWAAYRALMACRLDIGTAEGGADIEGETQRVSGKTVNGAAVLAGIPGQVQLHVESRVDVSTHGFWKRGTSTMFDIRIVNLDERSYLHMTPDQALSNSDKENKDLYLQACLERRRTFTPMVYSADRIPGAESLAAQKRLSALLSYKLKQEYSEMCGFVKARMSLAIVRSNSLILRVHQYKEARIR